MHKLQLSCAVAVWLCACGYGDNPNPPPLNNLKGYPSRGPVVTPEKPEQAQRQPTVEKQAALTAIGKEQVDAHATLTQVGDEVRVSLRVAEAPPGPAHVEIVPKSCDAVATQPAPGPSASSSSTSPEKSAWGIGDLTISQDGTGALANKLEGLELRHDLIGKSLVLYHGEPGGHAKKAREQPIACAMIH